MDKVPRIQEEVGVEAKMKEVPIHEVGSGGTEQLCSKCLGSARRLGQLEDKTEKTAAIVQV